MNTTSTFRLTLAACAAISAFAAASSQAAEPASAARSSYTKESADCKAGRTAEDRATCMKEAGAAAEERKRNNLTNNGSMRQNATDRCNALPAKDKADCMARIEGPKTMNQQTMTSGSVAGGGVIRETKTVTQGPAVVIPVPAASAPR